MLRAWMKCAYYYYYCYCHTRAIKNRRPSAYVYFFNYYVFFLLLMRARAVCFPYHIITTGKRRPLCAHVYRSNAKPQLVNNWECLLLPLLLIALSRVRTRFHKTSKHKMIEVLDLCTHGYALYNIRCIHFLLNSVTGRSRQRNIVIVFAVRTLRIVCVWRVLDREFVRLTAGYLSVGFAG